MLLQDYFQAGLISYHEITVECTGRVSIKCGAEKECYDKKVDDAKNTSNRYHFSASSSSSSNSSSSDGFSLREEMRRAAKECYQMDVLVDKVTNIENLMSSKECNKEDEECNQEESFLLFQQFNSA